MKKVICFARVSTVQQDLTSQLEAVKRCAISDGYNVNEIVEVTGKESAIKLAEEERITLAEIKKLVEEYPKIESIYFFAVDRLARRMSVVMSVKEWADEHQINLVFMNPHRMSTFRKNENGVLVEDEVTTLLLAMLSYGAAMEMKIKQARFATAKAAMKAQGKMISGKPIKGYMLDKDKTIVVNEDEAQYIRDIFDEYLNGNNESLRSLHDKYVVKGFFATPQTNYTTLAKTRMHNILTDCAYCGRPKELRKKQKDGTYKITTMQYPAIISEELFDAVQDKLHQRKSQPKRILENIYFAKGKIFCGECGNAMRTDTWNMVYKCSEKKNHQTGINMNAVDAVTWLTTKQVYAIYTRINQDENRANYEEYINNYVNKLKIINKQIDDKYAIIDRTNERYVLGKIKEKIADKIIDECQKAIIQWNKDKISIQQSINNYKKLIAAIDGETKVPPHTYDNFTDAEKKEIIDKMITAIKVYKVEKNLYNIYIDSIIFNTSKIEYYQYHSNKHTLVGINGEETVNFGYLLEEKRHIAMRNKKQ